MRLACRSYCGLRRNWVGREQPYCLKRGKRECLVLCFDVSIDCFALWVANQLKLLHELGEKVQEGDLALSLVDFPHLV